MQKIIISIIMLVLSASIVQAQTHNPTEGDDATMSVTVITPFVVENYDANVTSFDLPDVIMGQTRDLGPNTYQIFSLQKESGYKVKLIMSLPNPVNGVTLNAEWYFFDTPPDTYWEFPNTPLNVSFWWGENPTELLKTDGWVALKVSSIDASSATTTGDRTFTATCEGYYVGL